MPTQLIGQTNKQTHAGYKTIYRVQNVCVLWFRMLTHTYCVVEKSLNIVCVYMYVLEVVI